MRAVLKLEKSGGEDMKSNSDVHEERRGKLCEDGSRDAAEGRHVMTLPLNHTR